MMDAHPWLSFSNTHRALLSFINPWPMAPSDLYTPTEQGSPNTTEQYHLSTARQMVRKKGKKKDVNQHHKQKKIHDASKDPSQAFIDTSKPPPLAAQKNYYIRRM